MGIFSTSKSKFKEPLDNLEKEIEAGGDGTPATIGGWVQILDDAMDYNVTERNAKDSAEIARIQTFSVKCTEMLMDLITLEAIKDAAKGKKTSGQTTMDGIEQVGTKLDRVRSSPATTMIKERITTLSIQAIQEELKEAQANIKEVNTPERLSHGVTQVLKSLKTTSKLMGTTPNPAVVQNIVKLLTALVQKILPLISASLEKDATLTLYKNAAFSAEQIDKFALTVMPFLPGAKWNPCALSVKQIAAEFEKKKTAAQEAEVEIALQHSLQCAKTELRRCQDELDKVSGFNAKVVLESLEALGPVWPKCKEDADCAAKLKSICDAVEARITSGLDEDSVKKAKALIQFAQAYDKSLGQLVKRAPDEQGLCEKLKSALDEIRQKKEGEEEIQKAATEASELVGVAEAELEKEQNFNPMVLLQSLAKLKPVWEKGQNAELRERLQHVIDVVEARVQDSFMKALAEDVPNKPQALLKFAANCDEIRIQLEGTAEEEGADASADADAPPISRKSTLGRSRTEMALGHSEVGLKHRLESCQAVHKCLQASEEELAKEHGMNPGKVMGALKQARVPWAQADAKSNEALAGRLDQILNTISTRVLEAFETAVSEDNEKKQEALLSFASQFDAISSGLQDEEGKLRQLLMASDAGKEKRAAKISTQLTMAEEELAKDDTDIGSVLEILKGLQDPWHGPEVSEESTARLEAVKTSLSDHIKAAFSASLTESDEEKMTQTKKFARNFDLICMKLADVEVHEVLDDDEEEGDMHSPLLQELAAMIEQPEELE
eukprot:gnl/MRDRNA2_/MRDRNA2_100177_c0_seq1.p1 gnl/MRDRNA2_/MRDRNA2_100177_c0~~gnl/MRDRNA2_/MRDRNA2_100177_c0_seq1.p1  ORF type:complete len:781 (+),score=243.75 gnl/MRDRNA2_/MRDRNA2_100177_c0_seq1:100-2442(+)